MTKAQAFEDLDGLRQILMYHVVPAPAYSFQARAYQTVPTLSGLTVRVTKNTRNVITVKGVPSWNKAKVLAKNIRAGLGVIHVIDYVLLPFPI